MFLNFRDMPMRVVKIFNVHYFSDKLQIQTNSSFESQRNWAKTKPWVFDLRFFLVTFSYVWLFENYLTEPFFSERIKKHDQINGNLFWGFSAWKWLDWKVGINDLPLFLQSNPTAFYFLLFRPYKAGFSVFVTNICFFLLNFVLSNVSTILSHAILHQRS